MPEAVIVDAIRTPIGRAMKGSLKDVRADDLAAVPLKALVERNPDVDFSRDRRRHDGRRLRRRRAGLQRRPQRRAAGRASTITSPASPSTASAPRRCRRCAWPSTRSRPARATSTSPPASRPSRAPRTRGNFEFHPQLDGSEGSAYNVYIPMGLTAENVAERCNVTREQQDEWAVISQNRAVDARDSGHFDKEIVAVTTPDGTEVSQDDGPRPGTTMEKLAALKPAFKQDGTVTAGNACPLNDGAAAVLVMSAEKANVARPEAAGADHRVDRRGDPPGDHGPRPDPGDPGAARAGRDDDGRHRRRRDQRGVRGADRPVHGGARASTRTSSTRSAARSPSATPSG